MNDVNLNNVDSAARQSQSASSSSPPDSARKARESGAPSDQLNQQELKGLGEKKQYDNQVEATQDRVEDAVTKLNDYVQSVQRDLRFQLDDDSGKTVITVIDSQTSEVVRQIPDEVALKLAQDLQQDEPLSLFTAKV